MYIHGKSSTPTYKIWNTMILRCYNSNMQQYDDYGGRGITVCERWHDFESFLADMGERPEGMSIDRIDNDKGYDKANCKWSTRTEQNRNKRNSKLTLDQAVDICYRRITTKDSYRNIAADYDIPHTNVIAICNRTTWSEAMDIACKRIAQELKLPLSHTAVCQQ